MNEMEVLELRIAKVLRLGVVFAGILMLTGQVINFKFSGNTFFNFQTYDEIPLTELLQYYFKVGNWGALISFSGLIALISLPLIRVLLTTYLFLREKDFIMGFMALFVFISLILSMSLGITSH